MNLDNFLKRGLRYAIGYSPGRYRVLCTRTGVILSEHKSKREAISALKRYKAADARHA